MLEIIVPKFVDVYDEKMNEFITTDETKLQLEHSLISLKKWEQKWHKPFLGKRDEEKSYEETIDYIRCMTLNKNVNPDVYRVMGFDLIQKVIQYIEDPMTATWFNEEQLRKTQIGRNGEVITAEIIYYWMVELHIPVEFEKWHLNQLITLIKVINIKHSKPKKMSQKEAAMQRAKINAANRAKYHSKG